MSESSDERPQRRWKPLAQGSAEQLVRENLELKRALDLAGREKRAMQRAIDQQAEEIAFLASKLAERPQTQLSVAATQAKAQDGKENKYSAYFAERRRQELADSKSTESKLLEQSILSQRLQQQAEAEEQNKRLKNKYNLDELDQIAQLKEVNRFQQKKITQLQDFVQQLQSAPTLRRPTMKIKQEAPLDKSLSEKVRRLQIQTSELKVRLQNVCEEEMQKSTDATELRQLDVMQKIMSEQLAGLKEAGSALSDKAWHVHLKLEKLAK